MCKEFYTKVVHKIKIKIKCITKYWNGMKVQFRLKSTTATKKKRHHQQ